MSSCPPHPYFSPYFLLATLSLLCSKPFVPSVFVKATQTVKFKHDLRLCPKGPKGPASTEARAIFLQECNLYYLNRELSVKCTDVRCGSVLVDLEGEKADVTTAMEEIESKGLQLPTFSKLTVFVPEPKKVETTKQGDGSKPNTGKQTDSNTKTNGAKTTVKDNGNGKASTGKPGATTPGPSKTNTETTAESGTGKQTATTTLKPGQTTSYDYFNAPNSD